MKTLRLLCAVTAIITMAAVSADAMYECIETEIGGVSGAYPHFTSDDNGVISTWSHSGGTMGDTYCGGQYKFDGDSIVYLGGTGESWHSLNSGIISYKQTLEIKEFEGDIPVPAGYDYINASEVVNLTTMSRVYLARKGDESTFFDMNLTPIDLNDDSNIYFNCAYGRDLASGVKCSSIGAQYALVDFDDRKYVIPYSAGMKISNGVASGNQTSASGYFCCKKDGKSYLVDSRGNVISEFNYDVDLGMLANGYLRVGDVVISVDGEHMLSKPYDDIVGLDYKNFLVIEGNTVKLLTLDHWIGALNTDIRTYINGYEIPCWAVDGYAVIVAEDLRGYGFDVHYNDSRLNIKRNSSYYDVNPVACAPKGENGSLFSQLYTNTVEVYNDGCTEKNGNYSYHPDKMMKSYALNGYSLIRPEDLEGEGIKCIYNNDNRRLDITIDGLAHNDK